MTSGTLVQPRETQAVSEPERAARYRCECGHELRVSGIGRHLVYFERGDVAFDDPVMDRVCPECGDGLPGKSAP